MAPLQRRRSSTPSRPGTRARARAGRRNANGPRSATMSGSWPAWSATRRSSASTPARPRPSGSSSPRCPARGHRLPEKQQMLKSIDVLVGLVVIMLALSMTVTVITQFVTALFNSRGRHLKRGLADLLAQVDARLKGATGTAVVQALLTHPLVSGTSSRLGSVVHRSEFIKLLLELAQGGGSHPLDDGTRKALTEALAANGIKDPAATLNRIQALILEL